MRREVVRNEKGVSMERAGEEFLQMVRAREEKARLNEIVRGRRAIREEPAGEGTCGERGDNTMVKGIVHEEEAMGEDRARETKRLVKYHERIERWREYYTGGEPVRSYYDETCVRARRDYVRNYHDRREVPARGYYGGEVFISERLRHRRRSDPT